MGHGCTYCANNIPIGTKEFIRRAKEVWGDKYSYDKVEYVSNGEIGAFPPSLGRRNPSIQS